MRNVFIGGAIYDMQGYEIIYKPSGYLVPSVVPSTVVVDVCLLCYVQLAFISFSYCVSSLKVGGIKPGCFKVGNTGGIMDNIIASKLYRPGRYVYIYIPPPIVLQKSRVGISY